MFQLLSLVIQPLSELKYLVLYFQSIDSITRLKISEPIPYSSNYFLNVTFFDGISLELVLYFGR